MSNAQSALQKEGGRREGSKEQQFLATALSHAQTRPWSRAQAGTSAKLPAAATAVWTTWSHRQSPKKVPREENIHLSQLLGLTSFLSTLFQERGLGREGLLCAFVHPLRRARPIPTQPAATTQGAGGLTVPSYCSLPPSAHVHGPQQWCPAETRCPKEQQSLRL